MSIDQVGILRTTVWGSVATLLLKTVVVEVKADMENIAGSVNAAAHHTH
jgi:hypothetical protein